jgi:Ser/Thr protein kinase RdoA (MazF antagonist)
VDPRIELVRMTARVARSVVAERVTRPRPTTLREVPPGPESLTREWLTLALCDGVPGAEVTSFRFGDRHSGATARCHLTVEYNAAGRAVGLPEHLFTKSTPTFTTRLLSAAVNLNEVETAFYTHLRPELDIEAPLGYYAGYDPLTERAFMLLEDVGRTRGAVFGTVLTRRLTKAQAEGVVEVLATLHARYWDAPILRRFGRWVRDPVEYIDRLNATLPARKRMAMGVERGRAVIPAELYARRDEFHPALMRAMASNAEGPQTLLHTDVHPSNWYVTPDGRMGLFDFACFTTGGWARDVSYALATHLPPEDRREWERDLLAVYCAHLEKHGITPPSPDEAFLLYRQQMMQPMLVWLATLGLGKPLPVAHPEDVMLETVRRVTIAAADLGVLDAV